MTLRKWMVVRTTNDKMEVLDLCFTQHGANNARHYWWVLQQAVGNRSDLDVVRRPAK